MNQLLITLIKTTIPHIFEILKNKRSNSKPDNSDGSKPINYTTEYWRNKYYQQLYINSIRNGSK